MFMMFTRPLTPGQMAPAFSLLNQHGETITLSDCLSRQRQVLLYFYLAPYHPGSMQDLLALKAAQPDLEAKNTDILAVNPFDWEIQHQLAKRHALPFSVLYDPLSKAAKQYRAVLLPTFYNWRTSYLINPAGTITASHRGSIHGLLAQQRSDQLLEATVLPKTRL